MTFTFAFGIPQIKYMIRGKNFSSDVDEAIVYNHLLKITIYSLRCKLLKTKYDGNTSRKQVRVMKTPFHLTFIQSNWSLQGYTFFLIFALKHRLWVLIRTASMGRFYDVHTINILSKNEKNILILHLKIKLLQP